MKNELLDPRLRAAAGFARPGRRFADVGTDHAFLPVYLCACGRSPGGAASDINRGPIERARKNIAAAGLEDRICAVQTDGLTGLDAYRPEDVFILGMGGELILRIVEEAVWIRSGDVRLILQPMTHPSDLRRGLLASGFDITDEVLVRDGERIYQILCARWDGISREWNAVELLVGRVNLERGGALAAEYAGRLGRIYEKRSAGLRTGGRTAEAEAEETLARELLALSEGRAEH